MPLGYLARFRHPAVRRLVVSAPVAAAALWFAASVVRQSVPGSGSAGPRPAIDPPPRAPDVSAPADLAENRPAGRPAPDRGETDAGRGLRDLAYAREWAATPNPVLAAFRAWTDRYRIVSLDSGVGAAERAALVGEGVRLARERRAFFRTLMERDPQAALRLTVPATVRAALPEVVQAELETRFSGRGNFEVFAVDYAPAEIARRRLLGLRAEPFEHTVTVEGRTLRAFVYGRRAELGSKVGLPLHGIALDGIAAVHEHPLRVLDPEEPLHADIASAPATAVIAELAGRMLAFGSEDEVRAAAARLGAAETTLGPELAGARSPATPGSDALTMPVEPAGGIAAAPASAWTTGTKQILVIRVDFPDLTGEPRRGSTTYTADYVKNLTDTQVAPFYAQSSYGKTGLVTTVTTLTYRMPQTAVAYATGGTSGLNTELHNDARAAAGAHYNVDSFDRILVLFSSLGAISGSKITYGGLASVSGKNSWINGAYDFRVVAHELGHTYGLRHANLWLVTDGNPLSAAGTNSEYGDDFDTMGANFANDRRTDFNPWFKNLLGWVTDAQVATISASGTYRVNRLDNASGAGVPALRIPRDGTKSTWIGVRRNFTTNASMQAGAYLVWGYSTAAGSHLLDLNTPGSSVADAALAPSASLVDTVGNVSIRHAGNGGSAPDEYADIQVTLGLNGLPVFSLHPQSQGYDLGATVTLTAAVDGTAPLAYQWRKNGVDIAGATGLSLAFANAQAGAAGSYTLRASNTVGAAVSNAAVLAVNSAPVIVAGPAHTAATAGRTVNLTVAVSGAPAPTFQWRKDGDPISGATAATLSFLTVQPGDAAATPGYDVIVSNPLGSVTSAAATLAVYAAGSPPSNDGFAAGWVLAGNSGAVVGTNAGATGESGEPTHVVANGTATSVWYRLTPSVTGMAEVDTIGSSFDTVLAVYTGSAVNALTKIGEDDQSGGLNTSRLRFPVTAGTLYHIAVGDFSSARTGGNIALRYVASSPPAITTPPAAVVGTVGGTATFTVAASGSGLTYQWFRNGHPLAGGTAASLVLGGLSGADAGSYFVAVSNFAGTVVSVPVTLSGSSAAPVIATPPVSVAAVAGGAASFSVTATGAAPLTYQWRRNGFPVAGATTASLAWTAVSRTDADFYDVVVASGLSAVTPPAVRLSVAPSSYPGLVAPDPDWELRPEYSGGLGYVVTPASEGRAYIGGTFVSLDGVRRTGIARLAADGTLDPTFVPPEIDNAIRAIAVQPDGKVIIGGDFVRINGLLRNRVARLHADGSVDTAFAVPGDVNGTVYALALAADGRVYLGGNFTAFAGTNRNFLARVEANGTVDAGFANLGMSSTVQALLVQPDGKLVVGGGFTTGFIAANGVATARSRLARLNSDGTLDTAFAPAFNGTVFALARQSTGALLVGGAFTLLNTTVGAPFLARLDAAGAPDPGFQAALGSGPNLQVGSLAVDASDRVLVGGDFSAVGGATASRFTRLTATGARDTSLQTQGFTSTVHGLAAVTGNGGTQTILVAGGFSNWLSLSGLATARLRFARLNADGSLASGGAFAAVRAPGTINGMLALPGGKLLVTGFFTTLRGSTVPTAVARLNPDGTVDTTFNAGGSGANSNVFAAALQPDGRIVITGAFTTYNGTTVPGLARLGADGTVDASFRPGIGLTANSSGYALALLPGGRIFVGGGFTSYNGIARNRAAVVLANGALDTAWDPGSGASAAIYAAVAQSDGRVVIGGAFTSYNGTTANRIARLSTTGALDGGFAAGTAGANGTVLAVALRPNQQVVVGGSFGTMHGSNRPGLAVLSADGALDPGFAPVNVQSVYGVIAQEDGNVIARGSFATVGGQTGTAYLARFKPDGTTDGAFAAGGFTSSSNLPTVPVMGDAGQIWMQSNGATGLSATEPALVPVITAPPKATVVALGDAYALSVSATSALPVSYQWMRAGVPINGATNAVLTRTADSSDQAGTYSVRVSSELGFVVTPGVELRVVPPSGLTASATLAPLAATSGSFTTSFYVYGGASDRKPMLVRALGPTLTGLDAAGAVPDPRIEILRGSDGAVVAGNDNWSTAPNATEVAAAAARLGATPLAVGSKDAAVLIDLAPGLHHVRVTEATGFAGGRALLEVYEADATPRLIYFATRAHVGTGADAWTQHVNIRLPAGSYLVRALGPALGSLDALADPYLTVRQGGSILAQNDNWQNESGVVPSAIGLGAMMLPAGSKDAATRVTLSGATTLALSVHGVGGTTGTALMEIFDPAQLGDGFDPVFVVQPKPVTVTFGQPFSLGAVTLGRPTSNSFAWTKDGVVIAGASRASYSVDVARPTDAGEYQLITNIWPPQFSQTARVVVNAPPTPLARHRETAGFYEPGKTVTVEAVLAYAGTPQRVEWSATLPAGWSLEETSGDLGSEVPPRGATGTLVWKWTTLPPNPARFAYTARVAAIESGARTISAGLTSVTASGSETTPAAPGPLVLARSSIHTADIDRDQRIDLAELLRVIQLYNTRNANTRTGAYRVATTLTEDGLTADPDRPAGTDVGLVRYHAGDSNRDGRLSLVELTRVIELYNHRAANIRTGEYRLAADTEDGFAPGP